MSENNQKTEKPRNERLVKRHAELQEAVRKDIQALQKIVANAQPKPTKPK
jgi:hypothetical protein